MHQQSALPDSVAAMSGIVAKTIGTAVVDVNRSLEFAGQDLKKVTSMLPGPRMLLTETDR